MEKNCGNAVKETQVSQQTMRISNGLERLEKSVQEIEERLSSILNDTISKDNCENKSESPIVSLASDLKGFADRVNRLTDRIDDIKRRIEL